MKKIVTVKIVAEMEVDTLWYSDDLDIKKVEGENWIEWIGDHVISEEISIKDVKDEK